MPWVASQPKLPPALQPDSSLRGWPAWALTPRPNRRTKLFWNVAVLVATAMVPAAVVLAVRHSRPAPPVGASATRPVLVGTVTLSTTNPAPGVGVVATVTLRADRPLRLEGLRVAVRDEAGRGTDAGGRSYDYPAAGAVELSMTPQTRTFSQLYRTRGRYVYFLQYRSAGAWHALAPYESFTVG